MRWKTLFCVTSETWVRSLGWEDPLEKEKLPTPVSGLENSLDCIVHGITKSWTLWGDFHFHFLSLGLKRLCHSALSSLVMLLLCKQV